MKPPETVHDFLNQQEFWVNKDGFIRIDEMNAEWRRRAATFLLRRARWFGVWDLEFSLYDEIVERQLSDQDIDEPINEVKEFVGRLGAPRKFIIDTPLYQRLIQDGADPEAHLPRGIQIDDN